MSYEVIIDLSDVEHRSFDFKRMFDESIPCKERIVRCRDCKYHEPVPEDSGDWCGYWTDRVYGTDGFCKWGEPRGEGEGE